MGSFSFCPQNTKHRVAMGYKEHLSSHWITFAFLQESEAEKRGTQVTPHLMK